MKLRDLKPLLEEKSVLPTVTLQQAHDEKLFGPVYHGSSESGRENINAKGFVVDDSLRVNGYETSSYAMGMPAPIHHLGYGVYFTTVKAIGKKFNGNSVKGLKEYYLNAPNVQTINFAAPNTMMKWWVANGYNFSWKNIEGEKNFSNRNVMDERVRATKHLTEALASQYDAVWFKGKTIHKALDGDQVCIFKPQGNVFLVDNSSITEIGIGAKVRCVSIEKVRDIMQARMDELTRLHGRPETKVEIEDMGSYYILANYLKVPKDPKNTGIITGLQGGTNNYVTIKWKKGGMQYNYTKEMLELA